MLTDPHALVSIDEMPLGRSLPPKLALPDVRQPSIFSDEKLVDVVELQVLDAYEVLGILPPRSIRMRSSLLTRLIDADHQLPAPLRLCVLDAFRTTAEQQVLIEYYSSEGPTEGFVASLEEGTFRPPHTTGGAVDLTLAYRGEPLALGTDFDAFSPLAALHAFESSDSLTRRLRRVLSESLVQAGLVPYELEWWHWSFGDDVWAFAKGRPAIYGVVGER